jgi:hypothetical protein
MIKHTAGTGHVHVYGLMQAVLEISILLHFLKVRSKIVS